MIADRKRAPPRLAATLRRFTSTGVSVVLDHHRFMAHSTKKLEKSAINAGGRTALK